MPIHHSYKPVYIGILGEERCGQCGSTDWASHYWKCEEHNSAGNEEWSCPSLHLHLPPDLEWHLREELSKIIR